MAETLTDDMTRALMAEAEAAGDTDMADCCRVALAGSATASVERDGRGFLAAERDHSKGAADGE